jgi:hypothetical protein
MNIVFDSIEASKLGWDSIPLLASHVNATLVKMR